MITVKEFMEVVDYRITEGSDYGWDCFGSHAYTLSSWNGEHDGHSFNIVFDTEHQTVYQVEAFDYAHNRAYRLMHPDCVEDYRKESSLRNIDPDEALDEIRFVDLETVEDFIEKAQAIIAGEDYDTRVSIPLNIPQDDLLIIFKAAHERDMTLNEFVEEALKTMIADFEHDPEEFKARAQHFTNTDNPIDFPITKKKKKKKSG